MATKTFYIGVNMDPLTPSFPMEKEKNDPGIVFDKFDSNVDKYVKNIVDPIFEKEFAKETIQNRMSVGLARFDNNVFALYQPHNYRLYFDFQQLGFRPPKTDLQTSVFTTYKLKNSSEHFFKDFKDCTITVKKHTIEIINQIEHKRWYRIELDSEGDFHTQIKEIIVKKDDECREVLKDFIKEFGGTSGFQIVNRRSEDKVMFEDGIDKIPLKMAFHSSLVKKVYNERNVEFKDPAFVVNYLENRAIEKIAPDIANELNAIRKETRVFLDEFEARALGPLTEQIKLHLEVMNIMKDTQLEQARTMKVIQESLRKDRVKEIKREFGW